MIDTHTHIFSDYVVKNRRDFFHDSSFKMLYEADGSKIANAGMLMDSMNLFGVNKAFCLSFPWHDKEDSDRENQYILESSQSSPGKLIPFGSVPRNGNGKGNVKDYIDSLAKKGFAGIGEIGFYDTGFNKDAQLYLEKVLDGCSENNLIAVLHMNEPVGHNYKGKYHTDQADLFRILSEFPKVHIILAHWGGGLFIYELMPEIMGKLEHVYYDTAASPFLYDQRIFKTAIEAIGNKKILFGSDYPLLNPKRYLEQISTLSEVNQSLILWENAELLIKESYTILKQ